MPIKFKPVYTISSKVMSYLMRIEAAKEKVLHLPITPMILNSLRETARLYTTHYSTMIEGNQLEPNQINEVLKHKGHFPGREREEHEVKGYYAALTHVEEWATKNIKITEKHIQILHALVMTSSKTKAQPSKYRDGQNIIRDLSTGQKIDSWGECRQSQKFLNAESIAKALWIRREKFFGKAVVDPRVNFLSCTEIRDSRTQTIIYMPPEASDVKELMKALVNWINYSKDLPCPLVAAIAHYQFATIHPYYDGNGRTARLLTTLILYLGGYDLKRIYSLEEYYARNLEAYYDAISIGTSHNYYMGRAEADITKWIEYFIEGMVISFETILKYMSEAGKKSIADQSTLLKKLDPKQRKTLTLFQQFEVVTSRQIGELFGYKSRTSAALCAQWVKEGFLIIVDPSNRGRKYKLSGQYEEFLK